MDAEEGARRRELLGGPAGQLYRDAVHGSLPADDPRTRPGHAAYDGFEVLRDLGLVQHDDDLDVWVATDPTHVQSGVVVPIGRQAVDLLAEGSAWAETLGTLAQSFRAAPTADASGATKIRGVEQINRFLTAAVDDAAEELLTAQPSGPRRVQTLSASSIRDLRALERGVRMRTLYQHTARHSRPMREYVDMMREHGAQIRTLDEFFNRLIVIDRRIALIPGDTLETAVVIQDPALVSYLVDIFERTWERGRDYDRETRSASSEIAAEVRQLTIRMLTEGHSDSASAKRVGVSTRTYASYVAALKEEFGVQTRFQLGLAMGQSDGAGGVPDAESAPESTTDSAS